MASASQADFGGSVHKPTCEARYYRHYGRKTLITQVSPIGMASASQADFGGSDSRHLLHTFQALLEYPQATLGDIF